MKACSNNSLSIFGSFSQQSRITDDIFFCFNARFNASVFIISPRAVLMMRGVFSRALKKSVSAKWYVGYFPSCVRGVWNVTMSASRQIFSRGTKSVSLSTSCRGGSLSRTCIPNNLPYRATILPTWPTPTMPMVQSCRFFLVLLLQASNDDNTYCPTEDALQPGAFCQEIPFSLQ